MRANQNIAISGNGRPIVLNGNGLVSPQLYQLAQAFVEDDRRAGRRLGRWFRSRVGMYVISPAFLVMSLVAFVILPEQVVRQGIKKSALGFLYRGIKRGLDVTVALFGLAMSSLVFVLVPVIIKLDSRGSVFYSQQRVGRNRRRTDRRQSSIDVAGDRRLKEDRRKLDLHGRPFNVHKFRTMTQNAEMASGPVWASKNDPRVTRVGRVLRRARIDEIPQFFNVLRGEMSLVGPRPERPNFVSDLAREIPEYVERLHVRPGITGMAQVSTGYDATIEDVRKKLSFDLLYVKNGNFFSDVKILLKTVWVVLTGKGAV